MGWVEEEKEGGGGGGGQWGEEEDVPAVEKDASKLSLDRSVFFSREAIKFEPRQKNKNKNRMLVELRTKR